MADGKVESEGAVETSGTVEPGTVGLLLPPAGVQARSAAPMTKDAKRRFIVIS
jgi:hypothetical protein